MERIWKEPVAAAIPHRHRPSPDRFWTMDDSPESFEAHLAQLEALVRVIEDEPPLARLPTIYREAHALLTECGRAVQTVETAIRVIDSDLSTERI